MSDVPYKNMHIALIPKNARIIKDSDEWKDAKELIGKLIFRSISGESNLIFKIRKISNRVVLKKEKTGLMQSTEAWVRELAIDDSGNVNVSLTRMPSASIYVTYKMDYKELYQSSVRYSEIIDNLKLWKIKIDE